MQNKGRPAGASFYAESEDELFRFIAWGPPPSTGDKACMGLTGQTENQLVRDILDGKYNHLFGEKEVRV